MPVRKDGLDVTIAQLRHGYAMLAAGTVKDQRQFAEGLLGPAIARLEVLERAVPDAGDIQPVDLPPSPLRR